MGTTNKQKGRQIFEGGATPAIMTISADGVIPLKPGLLKITKGSAGAYTLPVPTGLPDGTELEVRSTTAFAHVVTVTGGFGGTGATRDVATFLAEVGAGFLAVVVGSLWHQRSGIGVTVA